MGQAHSEDNDNVDFLDGQKHETVHQKCACSRPVEDVGWMGQAHSEDDDNGEALPHLGIPGRHQVTINTLHHSRLL